MSHVLSCETGMRMHRLLKLVDNEEGMKVLIRWKGLPSTEDTFEPLKKIHEDVPGLLQQLLQRVSTPRSLADKARILLGLCEREG